MKVELREIHKDFRRVHANNNNIPYKLAQSRAFWGKRPEKHINESSFRFYSSDRGIFTG
jgi:hypothetical protein